MSLTTVSAPPSTYAEAMAALGREIRPGQRQLVERGVTLQPGHHLLVKAPTATGKTLAALITAGLRHQAGLGRTIIATYTRILQDQYADKDLTDAATLFPDMRIAILKGATNYVCRRYAHRIGFAHIRAELEATRGMDPGEVRHNPDMWPARADSTECKDHDPGDCGYAAAKQRARLADCVITNHTLVLLDGHGIPVLGEHDLLVVDECFVPEALVDTPDGPRPIGSLVVGDLIYGYDEARGIVVLTTVKDTMSREADVLGGFVTANHPVRTSVAYRPVADLDPEDTVARLDLTGVPTVRHTVLREAFGSDTPGWAEVLQSCLLEGRSESVGASRCESAQAEV